MAVQDAAPRGAAGEVISFAGHGIVEVTGDSELRRLILPVFGIESDGRTEPLGTAFCVCSDPPVLVTARHVVEKFIRRNEAQLKRAPAAIVVVLELGGGGSGDGKDRGAPIHVRHAVHYRASQVTNGTEWLGPTAESEQGYESDVALLVLPIVDDRGKLFAPDRLAIGFGLPDPDSWSYAFGYPELSAEIETDDNGNNGLRVTRVLKTSAGHVVKSFANGPPDEPLVNGPSFRGDIAMPCGMSGGPVLTDKDSVCAVVSLALDPEKPGGEWRSHAVGLGPALELPVPDELDGRRRTLRDLVDDGAVLTVGALPPPLPGPPEADVHTFALPVVNGA